MNFFRGAAKPLTRRSLLRSAGMLAAVGVLVKPGFALAAEPIDVTAAPYGASPSKSDNSPAFQAALNAIASNGGGKLLVPGGNYVLASPLTYSGGSLTVIGDGQDNTVFAHSHTGTALTVTFGAPSNCLTVRDVGFAPCGSGMSQCAISVTVPAQASGWQNVLIENVCLGVPDFTSAGVYNSYNTAISLTNTNRARINNVNVHANNITGGIAVALNGTCYDTRVLGSTLEGYATGVAVLSYCEGLHLANNVIICNTAVCTGTSDYGNRLPINLLELLMSDCEINTMSECMILYQVKNAQIINCHFTGPKAPSGAMATAIDLRGCGESVIDNCTFCSSWGPGNTPTIGIAFNPSSRTGTVSCHASNVQFENTMTALYFGPGATSNTATEVGLLAPGCGWDVNGSVPQGPQIQQVVADFSGNTTNNVVWDTSWNSPTVAPSRRMVSQH